MGCRSTNNLGRRLSNLLDSENIRITAPAEPTFFGVRGRPDILDVVLSRNLATAIRVEVVNDLSSDHNPLVMEVGGDVMRGESETRSTDWSKFKAIVGELGEYGDGEIGDVLELDRRTELLVDRVSDAVERATTRRPFTPSRWLPPHIRALLKEKRKAWKTARRTGDPAHRGRASALTIRLREALQGFRSETWERRLEGLSTEDGSLWKLLREMKETERKQSIKPIHGATGLVYSESEKAGSFADYLETVFVPREADGEDSDLEDDVDEVEDRVGRKMEDLRCQQAEPLAPATLGELVSIIESRDNSKAPGYDRISNRALKSLPGAALDCLLDVINASLRLLYFPKTWKRAVVVMIHKPGKDDAFPQHYRPISLLSTMAKIGEAVILSRLREELEEHEVVPDVQFGFRAAHSTDLQLFRLTEDIREGFERKETTAAIFLDLGRAFDTVWHDGVIYKILEAGMSTSLAKMIQSYLEGRQFQVRVGAHLSDPRPIAAGVPQGSLLGPQLFNIYMSDIPETPGARVAQYADDTAVYAACRDEGMLGRRLQGALDRVVHWLTTWKMSINHDKCQAIRFSRLPDAGMARLRVEDRPVVWQGSVKYLGLYLDSRLTFSVHFAAIKRKVAMARQVLNPLVCSGSKLSLDNKRLLYKTMVRPVISYGALAWVTAAKCHFRSLEVTQNKMMRYITGAPWFITNQQLRRDLQLETIEEFVITTATEAYKRAEASRNPLLREIFEKDLHPNPRRRVKRARDVLLAGLVDG